MITLEAEFIDHRKIDSAFLAEWEGLWLNSQSHSLNSQAAMVSLTIEHDWKHSDCKLVVVRDFESRLVALLPIALDRDRFLGLRARTLGNPRSPASQMLLSNDVDAEHVWQAVIKTLSRSQVQLFDFDWCNLNSPHVKSLIQCCDQSQLVYHQKSRFQVATIQLPNSAESLESSLSKNFRKKLRGWSRRLACDGELSLRMYDHRDHGTEYLRGLSEMNEIEASSWKADAGTAISTGCNDYEYWQRWMQIARDAKCLRLWVLYSGYRPIAFDMGAQVGQTYSSHKISYLNDLREFAPGHVRDHLVFQKMIEEKQIHSIDTIGPATESTLRWPHQNRNVGRIQVAVGSWASRSVVNAYAGLSQLKAFFQNHSFGG
ncbi:MAG: GNAT family N-acetyltransferase [Pirellulaceae bacterium]